MRLLIVDDDPRARSVLRQLCRSSPNVRVVGEAHTGKSAVRAISRFSPDVVLLDVDLPDMTGFDVLTAVADHLRPFAIMSSTNPEFAADAFAIEAVDYLVKPVTPDRFSIALTRVSQRVCAAPTAQSAMSTGNPRPPAAPKFIVGERERRLYPLYPDKIEFIEAAGNYVNIHANHVQYIARDTVKNLAIELADYDFIRIERSLLMNMRAVVYVERVGGGTYAFTLSCGARLLSSITYRGDVVRKLHV